MLFLLLRILFTVSFSHLLRLSQARTRRPMAAAAINYLVAAVICGAWAWAAGGAAHPLTLVLGGLAGFTYVTSLVMMLPAMRQSGVSVTGAVVQLSLMLPVGVAIWRFGEYPNAFQTAGIFLTMVALPLLSASRAVEPEAARKGFSPLTLLLFISTGASQVVMKEFSAARPHADLPLYSAALFAAATLFTWLWMVLSGDTGRPGGEDAPEGEERRIGEWPLGGALGAINMLQLVFLLLALRQLPAVIVFPVSASLGIACNTFVSMLLWKERPPPAGWAGIVLAVGAVVLLNVR